MEEQAIWIAFGVIAVVIGFSVVVNLINKNLDDKKQISFEDALVKLSSQCTFVCNSPVETRLSARVDIPSGSYLYTNERRICGIYKADTKCELCLCNVSMSKPLSLNTTIAKEFSLHSYECIFERIENGSQMDCKG